MSADDLTSGSPPGGDGLPPGGDGLSVIQSIIQKHNLCRVAPNVVAALLELALVRQRAAGKYCDCTTNDPQNRHHTDKPNKERWMAIQFDTQNDPDKFWFNRLKGKGIVADADQRNRRLTAMDYEDGLAVDAEATMPVVAYGSLIQGRACTCSSLLFQSLCVFSSSCSLLCFSSLFCFLPCVGGVCGAVCRWGLSS
jgi:hypothetical protein